MIAYMIMGVIILFCLLLLLKWYVEADTKAVLRALKWFAILLITLFIVWLALTGKLGLAFAALPALFVWFGRFRTIFNIGKMARRFYRSQSAGGQSYSSAQTSQVDTRVLRMSLDMDSGDMDGEILEGPHLGRQLSELSLEQLKDVLTYCQTCDEDSLRVLISYLDRHHGDEWRDEAEASQASTGVMNREEALEILGLEEGVSEEEIKSAYHRLIAQVHPDKGGSDYLASKINQAKDILLK